MLAHWITATIVGLLCGRALEGAAGRSELSSPAWLFLALSCCALASWPGRRSRVLMCSLLGLGWGLVHAAPAPEPGALVVVVRADTRDERPGPVLARAGDALFETYGPRLAGTVGRVTVLGHGSLLAERRTTLRATAKPVFPSTTSRYEQLVAAARRTFRAMTADVPFAFRAWLRGLVGGDGGALPPRIKSAFLVTGLYHLLVVSGLHVAIIAYLATGLVRFPVQLLYAARWLDPASFRQVSAALSVIGAAAATAYCALCGTSAASQRALLIYVLAEACRVFFGVPPIRLRLLLALAAQLALYPTGFLGEGSLMSWCAYVLVLAARPHGLRATLALQSKLLVLTGAIFGQLPLLGLIANPLLVPLFPFLLAVGLAEALAGGVGASGLALAIHANFIEWTSAIAALAERWPWLYVGSERLDGLGRWGLVLAGAALVLNAVRDLSIRGYEIIREVPPCPSLGKANRSSSSTIRHPSASSCAKPTKP
jgi:hypothetical protein